MTQLSVARCQLSVVFVVFLSACSTARPLPAILPPTRVILTDQNGNTITQITASEQLQQVAGFINQQRTSKPWRTHDPEPIADVVLHLCRGSEPESVFGTQTRLFLNDGHDTPAQPEEVDTLFSLIGQQRSLFTRVPLKQSHEKVSCQ